MKKITHLIIFFLLVAVIFYFAADMGMNKDAFKASQNALEKVSAFFNTNKKDFIKESKLTGIINKEKLMEGYSNIKKEFTFFNNRYIQKSELFNSIKHEINTGDFMKKDKIRIQRVIKDLTSGS